MKTGTIYLIRNTVNDKCYIGQTTQELDKRARDHLSGIGNFCLADAVKKYGRESFEVESIEEGITQGALSEREIYWIAKYGTLSPGGYNLTEGGEGFIPTAETRANLSKAKRGQNHPFYGKHHSQEHRRKISEGNKGKVVNQESRQKMSQAKKGHVVSQGHRRKLSEANKGKIPSEEHRRKLSEANSGEKNHNYGKHPSAETRKKLSDAKRGEKNHNYGRTPSAETRRKLSQANKGQTVSAEKRLKISQASKGRRHTAESRAKMSKIGKGRKHTVETRLKISQGKKGGTPWNKGKRTHKKSSNLQLTFI